MNISENKFYVYEYHRKDGTPYYVGKGTGRRAYMGHGKPCNVPKDKSLIIFQYTNLLESDAFKFEKKLIKKYGRKNLGTGLLLNKSDGGEGASNPQLSTRLKLSIAGKNCSPATRAKISTKNKGRIKSQEECERISKGKKGKPLTDKQKKHVDNLIKMSKNKSSETCEKISIANKGKKRSPEFKQKVSVAMKHRPRKLIEQIANSNRGKKRSAETCKRISDGNKGKKRSAETCKKISDINKLRKVSTATRVKMSNSQLNVAPVLKEKRIQATKLKNSKRVKIGQKVYPSVTSAADTLGIKVTTLYYHIKIGKVKIKYL